MLGDPTASLFPGSDCYLDCLGAAVFHVLLVWTNRVREARDIGNALATLKHIS